MVKAIGRTVALVLSSLIFLASVPLATPARAQADKAQAHKQAIRQMLTDVYAQGNFSAMDQLYSPDYVQIDETGTKVDLKAYKDSVMRQRQSVPDVQAAVVQLLAEGDWVAGRYYLAGTFTKDFTSSAGQKIPATNKPVGYMISVLHQFDAKDHIVKEIVARDDLNVYIQLGAIPMPANMATQSANQPATQPAMMPTDIKSIKEIMPKTMPADVVAQAKHIPARVADEAFSMGKFDVFDQSFDKGYMEYDNDQPAIGLDVLKAQTTALRAAMPDLKATSNPIVSEGDWIAFEFTYGGTFKNALTSPDGQSLPPTGKPLQSTAILFAQINDQGKVTSVYLRSDDLSFLMQIGVIKQ